MPISQVKPATTDLLSVNEKVEIEAQKAYYDKVHSEMGKSKSQETSVLAKHDKDLHTSICPNVCSYLLACWTETCKYTLEYSSCTIMRFENRILHKLYAYFCICTMYL